MDLGAMFMAVLQGVIMLAMLVGILAAVIFIGWLLFWALGWGFILIGIGIEESKKRITRTWKHLTGSNKTA